MSSVQCLTLALLSIYKSSESFLVVRGSVIFILTTIDNGMSMLLTASILLINCVLHRVILMPGNDLPQLFPHSINLLVEEHPFQILDYTSLALTTATLLALAASHLCSVKYRICSMLFL
jgi:hypothetical protein